MSRLRREASPSGGAAHLQAAAWGNLQAAVRGTCVALKSKHSNERERAQEFFVLRYRLQLFCLCLLLKQKYR
jgi:hypothetical protein